MSVFFCLQSDCKILIIVCKYRIYCIFLIKKQVIIRLAKQKFYSLNRVFLFRNNYPGILLDLTIHLGTFHFPLYSVADIIFSSQVRKLPAVSFLSMRS